MKDTCKLNENQRSKVVTENIWGSKFVGNVL